MNQRFIPDPLITTEAVFVVDDDLNILPTDLEHAFTIWKELGKDARIVGFTARHYTTTATGYIYMPLVQKEYSIVLTNAAMFHKDFLSLYWSTEFLPFRQYVDKGTIQP